MLDELVVFELHSQFFGEGLGQIMLLLEQVKMFHFLKLMELVSLVLGAELHVLTQRLRLALELFKEQAHAVFDVINQVFVLQLA